MPKPGSKLLIAVFPLLVLAVCCAFALSSSSRDALVVYCAHDSIYSEQLLNDFEKQTGIKVTPRFDTESTKSLGLVNLILQEQNTPQCDVFWNNELLGTLDLQEAGVLEPYKGSGYERIPDRHKDPNGDWTGFGGRLRVGIFNSNRVEEHNRDLARLVAEQPQHMAVANPLYGTTRTHMTVLWHELGAEQLQTWYRDRLANGMTEVQGNSMVKNLVAAGSKHFGWTDTDDHYVAVDQDKPVDLRPVRLENGQTICIPNTVGIIKGTDKLAQAKLFVDFLLSEETELALANSQSRQIPLGPCDESQLSDEVTQLKAWAEDAYDLRKVASSRQACLDWLKSERLKVPAPEATP